MGVIDKIVHQIWIQGADRLPSNFHGYVDKWRERASVSGYRHILWSETDYWPLLVKYDMVGQYTSRTNMTQKSDIARWVIMADHGGLYADVDIEPLFVDGIPEIRADIVLMHLPIGIFSCFTLQNAFVGVKKGHPFAMEMISRMRKTTDPKLPSNGTWNYISSTTGSLLIQSIIKEHPEWDILWLDSPYITFDYGDGYYLSTLPKDTHYFVVHQISGKEECNGMCYAARAFSMVPPWWMILMVVVLVIVIYEFYR